VRAICAAEPGRQPRNEHLHPEIDDPPTVRVASRIVGVGECLARESAQPEVIAREYQWLGRSEPTPREEGGGEHERGGPLCHQNLAPSSNVEPHAPSSPSRLRSSPSRA
jgi:hypothetical protein